MRKEVGGMRSPRSLEKIAGTHQTNKFIRSSFMGSAIFSSALLLPLTRVLTAAPGPDERSPANWVAAVPSGGASLGPASGSGPADGLTATGPLSCLAIEVPASLASPSYPSPGADERKSSAQSLPQGCICKKDTSCTMMN